MSNNLPATYARLSRAKRALHQIDHELTRNLCHGDLPDLVFPALDGWADDLASLQDKIDAALLVLEQVPDEAFVSVAVEREAA